MRPGALGAGSRAAPLRFHVRCVRALLFLLRLIRRLGERARRRVAWVLSHGERHYGMPYLIVTYERAPAMCVVCPRARLLRAS